MTCQTVAVALAMITTPILQLFAVFPEQPTPFSLSAMEEEDAQETRSSLASMAVPQQLLLKIRERNPQTSMHCLAQRKLQTASYIMCYASNVTLDALIDHSTCDSSECYYPTPIVLYNYFTALPVGRRLSKQSQATAQGVLLLQIHASDYYPVLYICLCICLTNIYVTRGTPGL